MHGQLRRSWRTGAPLSDPFDALDRDDLIALAETLWRRLAFLNDKMLSKEAVAERLGMSVSWLDNSQCDRAKQLRACGIRYGASQTSPIRFPLSEVMRICHEG